jgi:hypothetical protein
VKRNARRGLDAAVFCVVAVWFAVAPPAYASHLIEWTVSGSLAGSYSNNVSWVNCSDTGASGTAHESLRLNAKFSLSRPALLGGSGIAFAMRANAGGTWSMNGSYPPRVEQPDESIVCGAQRPFRCGGSIVRDGRFSQLFFFRKGSRFFGNYMQNVFFKETDSDSACGLSGTTAGPLFGLGDTTMEPDAFAENDARPAHLTVPRSRFKGSRPFTIRRAVGPDGGCPRRELYSRCTETGGLTLTLRFRRSHAS